MKSQVAVQSWAPSKLLQISCLEFELPGNIPNYILTSALVYGFWNKKREPEGSRHNGTWLKILPTKSWTSQPTACFADGLCWCAATPTYAG